MCCGDGQQQQDIDAIGVDNGGTIAMGNGSDRAIDARMAVGLQWTTMMATRDDMTTSWVKCECGTIRDNIQPANALRCHAMCVCVCFWPPVTDGLL
jgi:hypothetical protein